MAVAGITPSDASRASEDRRRWQHGRHVWTGVAGVAMIATMRQLIALHASKTAR